MQQATSNQGAGSRCCCSRRCPLTAHSRFALQPLHANGWYEGPTSQPLPRNDPPSRGVSTSRGGGREQGRPQPPVRQSKSPGGKIQGPYGFSALHATLREGQAQDFVIRSEAWPKLFSLISSKEDADMAMALMLQDAVVRDASGWDWVTHGYGQTIYQLVKAAGTAGAYHVCDWVLEHVVTLRLTVNKDTIPNFMRKFGSVQADIREMERLYKLEETVRGENTGAGFYELSRAYKRSGAAKELEALVESATQAGVVIKDDVLEDIQSWLQKRG